MFSFSGNNANRSKTPYWIAYGSLGVLFMILGACFVLIFTVPSADILETHAFSSLPNGLIRLDTQSSRFILRSGIPVLEKNSGEDDPFRLLHFNWSEMYWKLAANIRQATPREILKTQFPLLAIVKPKLPPLKISRPAPLKPAEPETANLPEKLPGEPVVLIYHTHTSESYIPVSGTAHQTDGRQGDITKVGRRLKEVLEEKYGIPTIHCDEVHDYYPFRESYLRSQVTVKKILAEHPSLKVVLDVHRDATPGIKAVTEIKGEKTATVLFVVGSNKMGLPHPDWEINYRFASKLAEAMNLYFPSLNSGIIVSDARYNQHLHHQALIVEFGDQNSNLEEVYRAVEDFAGILALNLRRNP